MKKLIKLTAVITALCYITSITAFASVKDILTEELNQEIDYMDDVYKYDLELGSGKKEEADAESIAEVLKYEKADNIVASLGLITFAKDGNFNEDVILSVEEFSYIADVLTGDSLKYASYSSVTHKDAILMVMTALGYDFMDGDDWLIKQAYKNRVIKNFSYNAEKHISRGEMAQLLYNALTSQVMHMISAGIKAEYKTTGETLLYTKFGMVEIEGLVTGVNGLDLYSNRRVNLNQIEIDRAAYFKGDIDTSSLFGKRVYGLVDTQKNRENTVHFIKEDPNALSLTVNFNQISKRGDKLVFNTDDSVKSISINSIEYTVVNGNTTKGYLPLDSILNGEGKITFTSSDKIGNYDIAIVSKYDSFVVNRFGSIDKKLHFEYDMTFEGENYISLDKRSGVFFNIIKNGVAISSDEIKAGDAVSIFRNDTYYQIEVSDKLITGEISSVDEEKVYIGEEEIAYGISPLYNEALLSKAKIPELKSGIEGSFLINALGNLASVRDYEAVFNYGVLKTYGEKEGGAFRKLEARIFNVDSEWFNYDFADKVTVDGKKMTISEAYDYLMPIRSELENTLIRYKLNRDDFITALDTIKETDAEEDDFESLTFSGEWHSSGGITLDHRKGLNLRNSTYSVKRTAKIFFIPENVDAEDEFLVLKQGDLIPNTPADLYFYNADEYFRSDLVIFSGETDGGSFVNTEQFLITNIKYGHDKDENEIYIIKGLLSVHSEAVMGWNEKTYTTTYQLARKYPNLKSGDLVHISLDTNGRVNAISRLVGVDGVDPNSTNVNNTIGYDERTYGTVVSVEPETKMMLVERKNGDKTELVSFEVRVVAIYDSITKEGRDVSLGDVNPGDKVYLRGGYRLVNAVVYR